MNKLSEKELLIKEMLAFVEKLTIQERENRARGSLFLADRQNKAAQVILDCIEEIYKMEV